MRRLVIVAVLLLAVGTALLWRRTVPRSGEPPKNVSSAGTATAVPPPRPATGASDARAPSAAAADGLTGSLEVDYPLAALLNAPNSTIGRDLDAMRQIFENWRSNFPHEGNPVGENVDIAAALTGGNRLGLVIIPKNHPALNARGEVCDRWGTPFRFHQLSGSRMEIRSAGPDRKFATADDAVWTPQ
jgi:hypothetical protein